MTLSVLSVVWVLTGSPTPFGPPVVGFSLTRTAMSMELTGCLTTRSLRKMTFRCQLLPSGVEVFS